MAHTAPSLDSVIVASDAPLAAPLGDETVLLHPGEGMYFSLNEVGTRVWALIEHPQSVRGVCDRIVEEFDVEPATCQADVLRVVADLMDHGLAELVDPDP